MSKRGVLWLLGVTALFFLPGWLSMRGFWMDDEARYADIIQTMIDGGDWWVMRLNGQLYPDKPPLYFWLSAALAMAFGGPLTPTPALLITAATTLGFVVTTYAIGCRMFDERRAFFGALAIIPMTLTVVCGQIVRMDMGLALFVALAMLAFVRSWDRQSGFALAHTFVGLAMMFKGPLALAFVYVPVAILLVGDRDWRTLKRFFLSPSLLLSVCGVGVWFLFVWIEGHGELLRMIFVEELAGRAIPGLARGGKGAIHAQPFWFYAALLPLLLLPWTTFATGALKRSQPVTPRHLALLRAWFIGGLVLISLIKGKLFIYPLPLLPPFALWIGAYLKGVLDGEVRSKGYFRSAILFFLLAAAATVASAFALARTPGLETIDIRLWVTVAVVVSVLGIAFAVTKRAKAVLCAVFAVVWIASATVFQHVALRADDWLTGRRVGNAMFAAGLQEGRTLGTVFAFQGVYTFYARSGPLREVAPENVNEFLASEGGVVVLRERDWLRGVAERNWSGSIRERFMVLGKPLVMVEAVAADNGR